MQVFWALGQSGVSNLALVRKKIKKNALHLNQSAITNFSLYVIKIKIYNVLAINFNDTTLNTKSIH